jgi:hypothetical protein
VSRLEGRYHWHFWTTLLSLIGWTQPHINGRV